MPRSGTTLLTCMLSAHPRIGLSYETHYLNIWKRVYGFLHVTNEREARIFIDVLDYGGQLERLDISKEDLLAHVRHSTHYSHQSIFDGIIRLHAKAMGKVRFGEKTPSHRFYVSTLLDWYPDARILHTIRDPRSTVSSMLKSPFEANSVYGNAYRWRRSIEKLDDLIPNERIKTVCYENLVSNPLSELQSICDHIHEDYSDSMLDRSLYSVSHPALFPQFAKTEQQKQIHEGAVKTSLEPHKIHRWKEDLTPTQIKIIERSTAGTMEKLGYKPESNFAERSIDYLFSRLLSKFIYKLANIRSALPHWKLVLWGMRKKLFRV